MRRSPDGLQSDLSHICDCVDAIIDEGAAPLFPDRQSFDLRTSDLEAQLECEFSGANARMRALAAVFLLATKCLSYLTITADLAACKTAELALLSSEVGTRAASAAAAEAEASALTAALCDIRGDIDGLSSDVSAEKGELAALTRAALDASPALLDVLR
jgi:hypothetical protein